MKYTIRHVRKYIEQGKIDPALWKIHFPHILESQVPSCEDCEDYRNNLCQGKKNPVDCFLGVQAEEEKKAGAEGQKSRKEKSPQFFVDAKGKKAKIPSNANKTFDQSKM